MLLQQIQNPSKKCKIKYRKQSGEILGYFFRNSIVTVTKDCCYHLDQLQLLLLPMTEYKKKLHELNLPSETVKK